MAIKSCSYGIINIINKFNQQTEPLGVSLAVLGLMDGRLASSFDDNTIKITNDSQFNKYSILSGHSDLINALAELDNHVLASGSCDNTIRLWNLTSEKKIAKLTNHTGCIRALLSISVNTKNLLISASDDKTIKIWENYKLFKSFANNSDSVKALAYSDRYRMLATGSNDRLINIYQLREYSFGKSTNFSWQKFVSVRVNALAILASSNNIVSAYSDKTIKIFEPDNFEPIAILIGHTDEVNALAILPSSERIVSGSSDTTIKIWDSETFECIANLTEHSYFVWSLAILPLTEKIVSGAFDYSVKIWDSETFECIATLIGHTNIVNALAILPSSERIVSGSNDLQIKIWDSRMYNCIANLTGHTSFVWSISILPSDEKIVSGSYDNFIKIWDSNTFECIATLMAHFGGVNTILSSLDYFVSSGADSIIRIWNSTSFQMIHSVSLSNEIKTFAYFPLNQGILSGNNIGMVVAWEIKKVSLDIFLLKQLKTLRIKSISYFNYYQLAAGFSDSSEISVWSIINFKPLAILIGHNKPITYLTVFNDQKNLASGSMDKTIAIWDAKFNLLNQLTLHKGEINSIAFTSNNSYMISSSTDTNIIVWQNASLFTLKFELTKFNRQTEDVIELNNGFIASASDDFTVKIWNNFKSFQLVTNLTGHTNNVYGLAELPEKKLASCSKDRSIIVWDTDKFLPIHFLYGHLKAVLCLQYISQLNYLASGSCDKTVIIWDLNEFNLKKTLRGHTDCINALNYYKNKYILSGSRDRTIIVWNLSSFEKVKVLLENNDSVQALASFESFLASGSKNGKIKIFSDSYSNTNNITEASYALAILNSTKIVNSPGDATITIWDSKTFELIAILIGHTDKVNALAILPSSERIVSGSSDTTIKIWDSETFECIANLTGNNDHIIALTILPSSERIVSGSYWPPLIKIWDSNTFEFITDLIGEYSSYLMALAILPSSENIVSGTAFPENAIKIWNSKTFELIDTIIVGNSGVWALSILPSSESIVIGIADGTIKIWRQTFITTLKGNWILSPVLALAVSPLTENIASAYADNTIRVWDSKKFILINTLVEKSTIEVTLNGLKVLEFFSPETLMAGLSNRIEILKIREFSLAGSLDGHTDTIYDLKFSNNADLVSSSKDETTKVWDISSFSLKKTENLGEVLSLFFLKNHDLVTASVDKSIKIWNTNFFYNISIIQ